MPIHDPISPTRLVEVCADLFGAQPGIVVGGVEGADAARPGDLAVSVVTTLRSRGRPAAVVHLADFIRPASVRMEHGKSDTDSFRDSWFDYAALDREVISAVRHDGSWLPRLWDERTDRSFRDRPVVAAPDQVLLVAGPMLLHRGLGLQPTTQLTMSEAALRRMTPSAQAWTIGAIIDHAESITGTADLVVRYDHPAKPAIRRR